MLHNFILEASLITDLMNSSDLLLKDINGKLSISHVIKFTLSDPVIANKLKLVSLIPLPTSLVLDGVSLAPST